MLDFSLVKSILLPEYSDEVIRMEDGDGNVLWERGGGNDYLSMYFFVEPDDSVEEDITLSIVKNYDSAPSNTIYYTETPEDDGSWTLLGTTSTTPLEVTVPVGGRVYLKSECTGWANYSDGHHNFINCSGYFKIGGNIMSLICGDNFVAEGEHAVVDNSAFYGLFSGSNVTDAGRLVLPLQDLTIQCYDNLFNACWYLVTAPLELPALAMAQNCYQFMFYDCSSLTTAPVLPATTLANYCYASMFYGCTSLVTAPSLPATSLADYCYDNMFGVCTSLVTTPLELPATTLASYCYRNMFQGCTSLVTAPSLPATSLADYCYSGMFQGCTSLVTAPSLPATSLADFCYSGMFRGCTSLTTAPALPATTLVGRCYFRMFYGCSSLNHIEVGFTQWNDSATSNWVNGVPDKNNGLFPEEVSFVCPDTLPEDYGVNRVPSPFWRMSRSENEYFYVENINGSAINVWIYRETKSATYNSTTRSVTAPAVTFEYSYDKVNWNTYTSSTSETDKISVQDGGRVYFRGNNSKLLNCDFYKNSINNRYFNLRATNLMRTDGYFNVGGNISSLVNSSATSFADGFTVPIGALFNNNTNLKHASRLNINAIGNNDGTAAYTSNPVIYSIFAGCSSLVTPPTLPSTTLNQIGARQTSNSITDFMDPEAAYYRMFRACSSLVYAPKLPATTLKNSCYEEMFYNCKSLTKSPVLPASTLVGSSWDYRDGTSSYSNVTHGCYDMMFYGCSSMNYIKAMFTTNPSDIYTPQWVQGVAASGTFVKNSSATWNVTGISGIPTGWTVQTASS